MLKKMLSKLWTGIVHGFKENRPGAQVFCPCCNRQLNKDPGVKILFEHELCDLVIYECACGWKSKWDFGAPCPLLMPDYMSPHLNLPDGDPNWVKRTS